MFANSAAWAQLERSIMGERVKASLATAQAEGKSSRRPSLGVNGVLVAQLRDSGLSWAKIAKAHPQVAKPGGKRVTLTAIVPAIAAGWEHTVALKSNFTLWTSGRNTL